MYKTTRFIGTCLITAGLTACGGDSDFKPAAGMAPEQLFSEACANCHGEEGGGKFGFLLSVAGSDTSVDDIVSKIREGGTIMPAFPEIDESEATAVANYLKNL
jgi:mono/diheme cytochrome c family protein